MVTGLSVALTASLFVSAALAVYTAAFAKVTNKRLERMEALLRMVSKGMDANAHALRLAADRLRVAEAGIDNLRKGYPRVVTGSGTSP